MKKKSPQCNIPRFEKNTFCPMAFFFLDNKENSSYHLFSFYKDFFNYPTDPLTGYILKAQTEQQKR